MNPDPLSNIFTNEQEVDPQTLADILLPFIRINTDSNTIFFTEEGNTKSMMVKIMLYLVARKALKFKKKVEIEEVSPAEIISDTGLKEGSVHPTLKILREKGIVVAKGGMYMIPHYLLPKVQKLVQIKD